MMFEFELSAAPVDASRVVKAPLLAGLIGVYGDDDTPSTSGGDAIKASQRTAVASTNATTTTATTTTATTTTSKPANIANETSVQRVMRRLQISQVNLLVTRFWLLLDVEIVENVVCFVVLRHG